MCTTCGCGVDTDTVRVDGKLAPVRVDTEAVTVLEGLLADNDAQAARNRAHFDQHDVLAVNLMSSPGAGKTALLEATIQALGDELRIAVIEGDLETENDAARIRRHGVPAIQVTTGNACHLDADMVHEALHRLRLSDVDLLFVENVGNLVCPASFDLGQHRNVTLLSVPEGDDKPAKYPVIFRAADLVLLTKQDLAPVMPEFSGERAADAVRSLASTAPVHGVSVKTGDGLADWCAWLRAEYRAQQVRRRDGSTVRPRVQPDGARLHAAAGGARS
ncbi:MAG: hydrogenase nickel incorporation protein HypB [Chromatiales bacterium]|nr:MAG: hydrogenase nickel incorporation protein HypB [Chromatiales bacterium]